MGPECTYSCITYGICPEECILQLLSLVVLEQNAFLGIKGHVMKPGLNTHACYMPHKISFSPSGI